MERRSEEWGIKKTSARGSREEDGDDGDGEKGRGDENCLEYDVSEKGVNRAKV